MRLLSRTTPPTLVWITLALTLWFTCRPALAGTLVGNLRDQNWYARYQSNPSNPLGVGYYEYAINGNGSNLLSTGAYASTGIPGDFTSVIPGGSYTIASWDVWWRSAFAFNVSVPVSGATPPLDLRLKAAMWGYPAFWDDAGYGEFGQTFVATGPIAMIYLRVPGTTAPTFTLTVHEGGPGGPQIGQARTFGVGDQRLIYGYGQMSTVAGQTYYARLRPSSPGVIMQMDPRPDFSDPMPGGCLWLGPAGNPQPIPDRDLGLVIMADDDGLITDMFTRSGGVSLNGVSIGQSFIARGVNLISIAVWLADPAAPIYQVTVCKNGPGGELVGTTKRAKPARVTADPEMLVTWAPGECPLVPGDTYYFEISRVDGGSVNAAMANPSNPFAYGQAYQAQIPIATTDLACTIMEEASPGSALQPAIRFLSDPQVLEPERSTNSLTVRWTTDRPADSKVEFAVDTPPYTRTAFDPALVQSHAVVLTGLKPHSLHHYRAISAASAYRPAVSRDLVICTKPILPNLLLNPGFEEGVATTAASRPLTNWVATGGVDIKEANGTWFWGLTNHSGRWLMEGAVNGTSSDGYIYQRVPVTPGRNYTFSAWLTTWMRENNTFKYDVWYDRGRLIYMRLGIDPYGGINPLSPSIQWTPRLYSHLHYSNLAKTTAAVAPYLTVFISMKGNGGEWHLYGADDCVLTETALAQPVWADPQFLPDGSFSARIVADPGVTNEIQISGNLIDWSPFTTLVQTNASTPFLDTATPLVAKRFYRLLLK